MSMRLQPLLGRIIFWPPGDLFSHSCRYHELISHMLEQKGMVNPGQDKRADAAFANPETYEYCEEHRITYFIRLPGNAILMRLLEPYLNRPVGRPPKSGIQVKVVDLQYQAKSWHKPRRVVAKIEWHRGELFPRIGFVVTNSRLPAGKVIKVYNGRADVENRLKEGKNTLRWDKTSCQRFEANQARLKMGVLAYNLLHMIRQFYVWGEEVRRSID
jgi:hypothetical protein